MTRLDDVSAADLRAALGEVEGKRPTQRLTAAIAHKDGVTQSDIADWYGIERRTVYGWFERIESEPLPDAVRDRDGGGRPSKLDDRARERLVETLQNSPIAAGYDENSWTPGLVRRHLSETFDTDYSEASCRRLMKEAGLRYHGGSREGDSQGWILVE